MDNHNDELENNQVDYRELPGSEGRDFKANPDKFLGGSVTEAAKSSKFPVLDMDTVSTAPQARPSLEEIKREKITELLEEHAKEAALQGPSQADLNAEAEKKAELEHRKAENERQFGEGLQEIVEPYNNFFARKAAELHVSSKPRLINLFPRSYQVDESTVDKNGNEEYPFRLRYHVEGWGKNKRFVPDSYQQGLAKGEKKIPKARLGIKFQDGEIRSMSIIHREKDGVDSKSSEITRIKKTKLLGSLLPQMGTNPYFFSELTFNVKDNERGANLRAQQSNVESLSEKYGYDFDSQNNVFKNNKKNSFFTKWSNVFMNKPHLAAAEFLEITRDTLSLVPTKIVD